MNPRIQEFYLLEIKKAKDEYNSGAIEGAWSHLERAHILSQAFAISHVYVHWKMFALAFRTQDFREMIGQIPRLLLAGPGSFFNRAPKGNTGRSNVGISTPMEVPKDLERILENHQ
ncbi:MAG: DUF3703 domain-containing protein [Bdellovibrionales bacterium]|nr:DUF3703 domain-containing protein [Bdellovibrionales bacterium]